MNKKYVQQLSSKNITISQAKTIIQKLNHEAPVLDVLLSGTNDVLQQVVTLSNNNKTYQNPVLYNQFEKLIQNQRESGTIDNSIQNQKYSFIKYKKCSYNDKTSVKKKSNTLENSSALNINKNIGSNSLELERSRIKSQLPKQLSVLKEQLLQLPSVYKLRKHGFSYRKKSKLRTEPSGQLELSTLSKYQLPKKHGHRRMFTNPQEVLNYYTSHKPKNKILDCEDQDISTPHITEVASRKFSLNNEKNITPDFKQVLQNMLKSSEQKKQYRQKKLVSIIQQNKIKEIGERFNQFMGFKEYPQERAMRMLDEANKIQKFEENRIEQQSLQNKKKDSLGIKFKMLIDWQRSNYKKNVQKLADSKKYHKINLSKIEAIANKKNQNRNEDKEQENHILTNKKLDTVISRIKLQEECKLINCEIWSKRKNTKVH